MQNYLDAAVLARAAALGLKARTLVEGLRVGDHKSPYRGFSVEFVQHREYVPGDDIRHIDWKSYGRSERYTIKQYEQETNFTAHLLVDGSRSMGYGSHQSSKLEYAKFLAASLAYLLVHEGNGVALTVFDDGIRKQLPVTSHVGHLQVFLQTLAEIKPAGQTGTGLILQRIADQVRRRGMVFLLSDCFDEVERVLAGLRQLRVQGHEVTLFHILHADELRFPFDAPTRFEGMESVKEIMTRPNLIRPAYLQALQTYLARLRQGCEAQRCDYVLMDTSVSLAQSLSKYLAMRLRVKRV